MKIKRFMLIILSSLILLLFVGCQLQQDISVIEKIDSTETISSSKGIGSIHVGFYIESISSNRYELYYYLTASTLINGFIGQVKVKSSSYLFPSTYLSKNINDGFPATTSRYGQYIGTFTVPSGTSGVRISLYNWKAYVLSEASWINLGSSWSGYFSL